MCRFALNVAQKRAFGVRALPAGELTALPRTLSWKREGRAGEEQGREREGRKKREGKVSE